MSKKLLFNEGGQSEKVPVVQKYTGTTSGYPVEKTSTLLDEEEKTFIEEIYGNTILKQDAILTTQEIVNLINALGVHNVKWEITSDGRAHCTQAGAWYPKDVIPNVISNNAYIQLSPNTVYSLVITGAYDFKFSYVLSDTKELLLVASSTNVTQNDVNAVTTYTFTTDSSGKVSFFLADSKGVNNPTSCIDIKLISNEHSSGVYPSDATIIYSKGTKGCEFTFENGAKEENNLLFLPHHHEGNIITNSSFVIPRNYKVIVKFVGYNEAVGNSSYTFNFYLPTYSGTLSWGTARLESVIKPAIDSYGYFLYEWVNTTNSDIQSTIRLCNYFGEYYISDIAIVPPYYMNAYTDIYSVGRCVTDDLFEIEIIQTTCPYEFGKGGKL